MGAYSDRVIADGASYYWRLGETAGTTAVDEKGLANGTISGGVTLAQPGAISDGNKAMTFNGTTGKVVTAAVTVPVICTIELWIKTTSVDYAAALSTRAVGNTNPLYLALYTGQAFLLTSGGSFHSSGGRVISDGAWHHFVCVRNATTVWFYLDGILDNSGALGSSAPSTTPAGLAYDPEFNQFSPIALDEVAIYPRALTAPEIAVHYTLATATGGGVGGVGPRSLGYWKQVWPAA